MKKWAFLLPAFLMLSGCELLDRLDMRKQPKVLPYTKSDFYEDGRASRLPVPGTVARGHLKTDTHLYEGKVNGQPATTFPFPITPEILDRGQERYGIYCSVCHGAQGDGLGMIVRRGFPQPTSFHTDRMRNQPVGYYFDVITNGYGRMYSYKDRVPVDDRWAIIAYIRALQRTQLGTWADVPASEREKMTAIDTNEAVEVSSSSSGTHH